ncbi:MAG: hypothetical protein JWM25_1964, partial [Thermoleophilia bacterium]|nr:hypothetical protein [Thermoleophilia bacterium]
MIDGPDHDSDLEATDDVAGIGVGMGGSCPECRAPVDLGQEFCLECGSAIRFTGRQRRGQRAGDPRPRSAAPAAPIPGRSFPWAPFAIILILVIGGLGFALMDGDSASSSKGTKSDTTEPALPSITNSTPERTTSTETVETCPDGGGFAGTEPAVEDGSSGLADSETGSEAEIPQIDGGGLGDGADAADQSIPPTDSEDEGTSGST